MCSNILTMRRLCNIMRSKGGAKRYMCGEFSGRIANNITWETNLMLNLMSVGI